MRVHEGIALTDCIPFGACAETLHVEKLLLQLLHNCHQLRHHPILAYSQLVGVRGEPRPQRNAQRRDVRWWEQLDRGLVIFGASCDYTRHGTARANRNAALVRLLPQL